MTYTITKDFAFSASHVLLGLVEGHQCGRLHGHNYLLRIALSSTELDSTGFVLDFGDLSPFKRWVDDHLDHRHLNDVLPPLGLEGNPSAERMARWLAEDVLPSLVPLPEGVSVAVGVRETDKCWAWWGGPTHD